MITGKSKLTCFTIALLLLFSSLGAVSAQTVWHPKPPAPEIPPPALALGEPQTSERSISVDPRVNVSLCVTEGNVKISGWERDEVRIFIKDGSGVGYNVLQKGRQDQKPVWINATGAPGPKSGRSSECLWGNDIEIDVPTGAAVSVKGRETKTRIDSVRKASVKNVGGDILVRNVSEGVTASTYEGDVTVENSEGAIALESATGNIITFEAAPSEIGDIFKAKTNSGAILLQGLSHREIEVSSISGTLTFNGSLSSGGVYRFGTSNGAISLGIPQDSSFLMDATFGYGQFNSEIPLKTLTDNISPTVKRITAQSGNGDSRLTLSTTSGAIRIRRQ